MSDAREPEARTPPYFFVHLMKTGGSTFSWHLRANAKRPFLYPRRDLDPPDRSYTVPYLLSLPADRRRTIRAYEGHFPAMVVELMGEPLRTITMLREPVSRTVSHLRMLASTGRYAGQRPEALYENPAVYGRFLGNHQVKVFALEPEDRPVSHMHPLDIDDRRFAAACDRLERFDVVGVTERFDDLLAALRRRWDFRTPDIRAQNESAIDWAPAPGLRKRIEHDVAADTELHQLACRLADRG